MSKIIPVIMPFGTNKQTKKNGLEMSANMSCAIYKTLGVAVNIRPPQETYHCLQRKWWFLFSGERVGVKAETKIQSLSVALLNIL